MFKMQARTTNQHTHDTRSPMRLITWTWNRPRWAAELWFNL